MINRLAKSLHGLLICIALTGCGHQHGAGEFGGDGAERIQRVAYVALLYRNDHGELPRSLAELCEFNGETPTVDSWGNEIFYSVEGEDFTIFAAGPDGVLDTKDDVRGMLRSAPEDAP